MKLFSPLQVGSLELKNRFAKSATHESMSGPDGEVTEEAIGFYKRLARGGVGLIITGNLFINRTGHNWPLQLGIHSDDMVAGLKLLTDGVHAEGGVVFAQLNHCGRESSHHYNGGSKPVAPSRVPHSLFLHVPRAMDKTEISETIAGFARAARRAKQAGFDGVQLHGAHGYLINQFLSPLTNRRRDEYGGSLENRQRFVKEAYHAVREEVGNDFPITIKINATDHFPLPIGIRWKEARQTAVMLGELGFDAIEVSCGLYESGMTMIRGPFPVRLATRTARELARLPCPVRAMVAATDPVAKRLFPFRENYNLKYARELNSLIQVPVLTVGGVRDPASMEDIISEGAADMISLARPLIAEPEFVNRIANGDLSPSKCVNCNICLMHIQVKPLKCYRGKMPKPESFW